MESLSKRKEMKSLDEVIKAFEYTYENDPTAWTYGVDALHYLKEYRETKKHPVIREVSSELLMLEYFHNVWQTYRKEKE